MTASANKTTLSVNYTGRDYFSLREDLIARVKDRVPGWTGNDPSDFGLALIESFAYMGDLVNYYIDRTANESYLLTATQRESLLNIAKMYGYSPSNYVSAVVDVNFTSNNGYSGDVGAAIVESSTVQADSNVEYATWIGTLADGDVIPGVAKLVVPNDHPFSIDGEFTTVIVSGFPTEVAAVVAGVDIEYNTSVFNGTFPILSTGYDNIGNNVIQYRPQAAITALTTSGTEFTASWNGTASFEVGQKINLSGVTVASGNNYNGTWFIKSVTDKTETESATFTVDSAKHVARVTKVIGNGTTIRYSTFGNDSTSIDVYGHVTPSWHLFSVGQKVTTSGINPTGYNLTGATVASVKDSVAVITNLTTNGTTTITATSSKPFAIGDIVSIRGVKSLNNPDGDPNLLNANNNWNVTELPVASVDPVTATITNVEGDSTGAGIVKYTTSSAHNFTAGQYITITGMAPDVYDLTEVKILAVPSTTTFTVTAFWNEPFETGGTATLNKFTLGVEIQSTETISNTGNIGSVICKQFTVTNSTTGSFVSGGTATALIGGTPTLTDALVTYGDIPVLVGVNGPIGNVKNVGVTVVPAGSQVYAQVVTAEGNQNVIFSTENDVVVPFRSTTTALLTQGERVELRADNAAVGEGDIAGELLGYSKGAAVTSFDLKETRVNEDSVRVFVDNGIEFEEWTKVSHIMDHGPNENVFEVVVSGTGTVSVVFGDGISGRIPPNEMAVKARYVAGGGVVGNVGAGTIQSWGVIPAGDDPEAEVRRIVVSNPSAASGGLDPESNDSIRYNSPKALRSLNRAVTLQDFADLALSVDRVAKANAVSAHKSSVTLYMAPNSTGAESTPGYLGSEVTSQWTATADNVERFLSDKVLLGTTVTILPPVYTDIVVEATFTKAAQYSSSVVRANIKKAILEKFAYDNVDFADIITPEEIEFNLRQVDGVINARVDAVYRLNGDGRNSLVGESDEIFVFTEDNILLEEASAEAALTTLTIAPSPSGSATWITTFNGNTYSYRVTVPNGTTSITATPTAVDEDPVGGAASITVNGKQVASGSASSAITTAVGNTQVVVTVTAGDGVTVKVYKITVTRAS